MIIKVNYSVSDIYIGTTVSAVYIKVVYSGVSGGGGTWGSITGTLSNQTDLQGALDNKVPYTGATGAVNLGAYDLTVYSLTIGRGAGAYINNTVLGSQAGAAFTTAQTNVAIGEQSLKVHSTGNGNTAVGRYAMLTDVDGTNNTALGASSLVFLASGGNTGNTAIGVNGLGRLTSGSYNTWLGYTASPGGILTSGSYNTILGAQVNVGVATLNNNIILADGQGNIRFRDDATSTILSRLAGVGTRMVVTDTNGALSTQAIPSTSGFVSNTRNINTTSPLIGGGDLSADRTLSIPAATTSVNGYLTSTDWNTFNGKQAALTLTTTGTSGAATLVGATLNIPQYSGTNIYNASGTLTAARTLTLGGFTLDFIGSSFTSRFTSAGRLLLGTTTESTYILDVNGTMRLTGAITGGSGTYDAALQVTSAGGVGRLTVRNDGFIFINANVDMCNGYLYARNYSGAGSRMAFSGGGQQGAIMRFENSGVNHYFTSGYVPIFSIGNPIAFTPSSGTGQFTLLQIDPTINQTGGANGITRGIYLNPTLTAAADWRAIEISGGGVYVNTTSVAASAILQADSTTKGFLPPRMTTTQINAIATPAAGLMAYNTDLFVICFYDGTNWKKVSHSNM